MIAYPRWKIALVAVVFLIGGLAATLGLAMVIAIARKDQTLAP